MRIEQSPNRIASVGTRLSAPKELFETLPESYATNAYKSTTPNRSPVHLFSSMASTRKPTEYIAPKTIEEEVSDEERMRRSNAELDRKWSKMNDKLLGSFGISGSVAGMQKSDIPNNYTVYFIQPTDPNQQNKVIIELENGECLVSDTPFKEASSFFKYFDMYCNALKLNNKSFDVTELKALFEDFLLDMVGNKDTFHVRLLF